MLARQESEDQRQEKNSGTLSLHDDVGSSEEYRQLVCLLSCVSQVAPSHEFDWWPSDQEAAS